MCLRGINTRAEVCANHICNSHFHTYRHERLQTMKQRTSERHQQESEDVRQAHLLRDAHECRATAISVQTSSRQPYLHEKGWADPHKHLHNQPWVKD